MKTITPNIIWQENMKQAQSWEELCTLGMEARETKDNSQWILGDIALQVEKDYGSDSLGKFAVDIGINKRSLYQYRRVSQAFTLDQRSPRLSHRHHLLLASHDDRLELLKQAEDENLSCTQLELKLSGKTVDETPKPLLEKCPICHRWKVEGGYRCYCGQYKFKT